MTHSGFRCFIQATFLFVISVLQINAQAPSTEALYDEVKNYVGTKIKEIAAKGKKVSPDDRESLEKAKKDLAAKYAATVASSSSLSNVDLVYLGLLYEEAENDDKAYETFSKLLANMAPDATGNAVQMARSRIVIYAAKKKQYDEMEKAYEAWKKGITVTAAVPAQQASLEGSMAAAYFNGKNYDRAIKYGNSALELTRNLEAKTWKERGQKSERYAILIETLVVSYQKADRKEDAIDILAEGRALAFTIPSSNLYKKVMEIVSRYGVSEKKLMQKVESYPKADAAPEFPVASWLGQDAVTLEDLRGKVVLLDFWATWCGPCISTFPRLRNLYKKYNPQGLTIIGVTKFYGRAGEKPVDRPGELDFLKEFKEEYKLPYGFAIVDGQDASAKYGVNGIPATFLLDRRGVVRYIGVGASAEEGENLEEMIKKVLAEDKEKLAA